MTVLTKELRQMAASKKIPNRSYMNRQQLLDANNAHDAGEPLPEFIRQPKKVKASKVETETEVKDEVKDEVEVEVEVEAVKPKRVNNFHKWCLKTATDQAITYSAAKKLGHLYKAEMEQDSKTSDMAEVDADITEEY
jgi:hypothetical protein